MENLNDKAVSASEIYTTGSTFFSSTSSNLSRTTIEIRLPKEMLIRGIWWSAPDSNIYVQNFGSMFYYDSQFSTWFWSFFLRYSERTKNPKAQKVTPIMFPAPILSNSLRLENLIYYESTMNSGKIPLQVELFGCEEYQLDEGLIFLSL
jgi:hypothetical protein